jgi:hypothetical protein
VARVFGIQNFDSIALSRSEHVEPFLAFTNFYHLSHTCPASRVSARCGLGFGALAPSEGVVGPLPETPPATLPAAPCPHSRRFAGEIFVKNLALLFGHRMVLQPALRAA